MTCESTYTLKMGLYAGDPFCTAITSEPEDIIAGQTSNMYWTIVQNLRFDRRGRFIFF